MLWWWWLILVATLLMGVLIGRLSRRLDARRWMVRAVQMSQINDDLMDRVDALEQERQKED